MTLSGAERIVVDTSVVSVLSRPEDPRHSFYNEALDGRQLSISFQTLEERWYGAYYRNWGDERTQALEAHLRRFEVIWPNQTLVDICAASAATLEKQAMNLRQQTLG